MILKRLLKKIIGINSIKKIKTFFRSEKEKELLINRKNFYLEFLSKGDIYFDIGANYGNRIEPLIDSELKIIAVEPQEECVKYLKQKFKDKITVLKNGLGSKNETKTMYISDTNTLSSFSKEWIDATKASGRFSQYKWQEQRQIEMLTLDQLINKYGHPNFIKIDVEGFELEVLKGLTQPFDTLSIEYTVPERLDSLKECLEYINTLFPNATFNYCKSEIPKLVLETWLDYNDFLNVVDSLNFLNTKFGDVYVKND